MFRNKTLVSKNQSVISSENPYEVVNSETQHIRTAIKSVPRANLISIAVVWMAGTTIAGAVFGTLIFPIFGTLVGLVLAAITGLPTSLIIFTVARLMPGPVRSRSTVLCLGALSGGLSGFSAVTFFLGFQPDILFYALGATCFGAIGNVVGTYLYLRKPPNPVKVSYTPAVWADLDQVEATSGEFRF